MNQKHTSETIPVMTSRISTTCFVILLICQFVLAACASSTELPAQVMEAYYQALTKKDLNTMISLACPEWEEQARNEYNSFGAVTTELQGLQCETIAQDQTKASVNCRGKIVANYGNEVLEIDLSKFTFELVQQGGNWRFCGYP